MFPKVARQFIAKLSGVFVILLLGNACGARQLPAEGVEQGERERLALALDHEVTHLMKKEKVASYALTLVDENGPIYEGAFGFADSANEVRASLETPYRWGSNSKVFVMLALLQLEAQGKLSLDDPLVKHLAEFRIGAPPLTHPESADWQLSDITLRSMLTHHSGLPNDYLRGFLSEQPLSLDEYLRGVTHMRAQQPVGLSHSYSNLAYTLLGLVVERASQQSFDDYVRQQIFMKVAMDNAAFVWNEKLRRTVARPYDGAGKERPLYEISAKPAGALIATTREMGNFATAILRGGEGERGRFIERALLESTYQRQNADVALDFDLEQALTWRLNGRPVQTFGRSIQHGGGVLSHHTAFVILRDHKLGVLVATNSERGARSVQDLAWKALALAIQMKTGAPLTPPPEPPKVQEAPEADLNLLQRWEGHYATVFGDIFAERKHDELAIDAFGRKLFLKPVEPEGLGVWAKLFGFWEMQPEAMSRQRISLRDVAGRKAVVQELPWATVPLGVKYEPETAPPIWKARTGRYRLRGRSGDHHFVTGMELLLSPEGYLLMRPELDLPLNVAPASTALHPVDAEWAVTEGIGRNKSVWIRFDDEGDLHFSGLVMSRRPDKPHCYGDIRCRGRFWKRKALAH